MPNTIDQLRASIARLEQATSTASVDTASSDGPKGLSKDQNIIKTGLHQIDDALPWHGLPRGCVHEIMSPSPDDAAATAFLAHLMGQQAKAGYQGAVLWVSCRDDLFAPGLAVFGWHPDRLLTVRCQTGQDVLWSMEEGLRCPALAAVAGDIGDMDFDTTRRLHMAARRSGLPLFLMKPHRNTLLPSAAMTRWKLTSKTAEADTGQIKWQADLLRCRGGQPQSWTIIFNLDERQIQNGIKESAKLDTSSRQPAAYAA